MAKASPSVVLILTGKGGDVPSAIGSGVIVRADGVLLTANHLLKDAQEVQVRLKSGEIFDRVELLGVDDRRDVAALRIPARGLPTLPTVNVEAAKAGEAIYVVSHAGALKWTASAGVLSAVRLADEVPGAGSGYRLLQFTAPISPGSSGGILVDAKGNALGIVLASAGGQNLNFAVPIESVLGLANAAQGKAYGSGARLQLSEREAAAQRPAAPPQPAAPSAPPASTAPSGPAAQTQPAPAAHAIFIREKEGGAFSGFPAEPLVKSLMEHKEFEAMGFSLVTQSMDADILIELDRPTMSWDCTYRMTDKTNGVIIGAGKDIAWDCIRAAPGVANQIVAQLKRKYRPPTATPAPTKP